VISLSPWPPCSLSSAALVRTNDSVTGVLAVDDGTCGLVTVIDTRTGCWSPSGQRHRRDISRRMEVEHRVKLSGANIRKSKGVGKRQPIGRYCILGNGGTLGKDSKRLIIPR
jgi:hypothetical protein